MISSTSNNWDKEMFNRRRFLSFPMVIGAVVLVLFLLLAYFHINFFAMPPCFLLYSVSLELDYLGAYLLGTIV